MFFHCIPSRARLTLSLSLSVCVCIVCALPASFVVCAGTQRSSCMYTYYGSVCAVFSAHSLLLSVSLCSYTSKPITVYTCTLWPHFILKLFVWYERCAQSLSFALITGACLISVREHWNTHTNTSTNAHTNALFGFALLRIGMSYTVYTIE